MHVIRVGRAAYRRNHFSIFSEMQCARMYGLLILVKSLGLLDNYLKDISIVHK